MACGLNVNIPMEDNLVNIKYQEKNMSYIIFFLLYSIGFILEKWKMVRPYFQLLLSGFEPPWGT